MVRFMLRNMLKEDPLRRAFAVVFAVSGLLLSLVPSATAQGAAAAAPALRVGVVDMSRVAQEFRRYQEAAKVLERKKEDLQGGVNRQEEEVVSMIEELDRIRSTAAPEDVQARRRTIEDRDRDLADFVERTNRELRDSLAALQLRTRKEVEEVVQEVSRTSGVNLVLERNFSLFAAPDLDLTDRVLARLNEKFPVLPAAEAIPRIPPELSERSAAGRPEGSPSTTAWPEPRREGFRSRFTPPAR